MSSQSQSSKTLGRFFESLYIEQENNSYLINQKYQKQMLTENYKSSRIRKLIQQCRTHELRVD